MEKMSDFFSELKERISNPFIFSYLFAWCIWNYQIVVALIFYKNTELKLDGYNSYLDLIICFSSTWKFFWLPLFSALGYTFLFPFFRNLILAFGVWMDTWGGNLNLKLSKSKKIPVDEFLKIKADYMNALEKVVSYSKAEADFNTKKAEFENEKLKLIKEYERLELVNIEEKDEIARRAQQVNDDLENWKFHNSVDLLQGKWDLRTKYRSGEEKHSKVEIEQNLISIYDGVGNTTWRVTSVLSNLNMVVVFMKHLNVINGPEKMWKLVGINEFSVLDGNNTEGEQIYLVKS